MNEKKRLTKKQLVKITDCPPYIIDYLYRCNRLVILKESLGPGYPIVFGEGSIKVIRDHMAKQIGGK